MDDLTPDKQERQTMLFDLRQLQACQTQYGYLVSPYANTLWIHATDLQKGDGLIVIGNLINEGILKAVDVSYQQQGDYRDRFAPYAYVLTNKGLDILENPSLWVFKGETVDPRDPRLPSDERRLREQIKESVRKDKVDELMGRRNP